MNIAVTQDISSLKNGCLYVRVSTDEQLELSPDAQLRLLQEYAHKNNIIISPEHIFIEHSGISGRKANKRPMFQEMIATCKDKTHPIDVILVWKFSRFARNQEESIVYKSLLKRNNVDVVSISEPLPDGMIGNLVERIFEWMDEYYSINLSTEVIRGMTENALRGNYQGSIPIGYIYQSEDIPPIIDEEKKTIIKEIFESYASGASLAQIARALNAKGYRTNRNSIWENRTVKYVLQNPFYIGKVRWNYYDRANYKYNNQNDIIIADGKHEPIIDMELWNKVQDMLAKKVQPYRKRDVSTCKHWLSGMLICSSCGKSLTFVKANNYFQCYAYGKGQCKTSHAITESKAIEYILQGLRNVLDDTDTSYTLVIHEKKQKANAELEQLNKALKKISAKEQKIKDAYINGIDTLEEYKENKMIITSEKENLITTINKLKNSEPPKMTKKQQKDILIRKIKDVLVILENKKSDYIAKGNAIRSVVSRIVFDRTALSFTFEFFLEE